MKRLGIIEDKFNSLYNYVRSFTYNEIGNSIVQIAYSNLNVTKGSLTFFLRPVDLKTNLKLTPQCSMGINQFSVKNRK